MPKNGFLPSTSLFNSLVIITFCQYLLIEIIIVVMDQSASISGAVIQPRDHCNIDCIVERFDIGKDCVESGDQCQCIAHCCWAFDCRLWSVFAQCRKKCKIQDWTRFGPNRGSVDCDRFPCYEHYLLPWDIRNIENTTQINCIQHCCYAFNCKRFGGWCRETCTIK
ncbi:hypothetical protein NH340_JMT03222 [Sarcoptes scabiei]|nr:hypothetical protein NH340_JMT03222 [Sarcoptes scabiei]